MTYVRPCFGNTSLIAVVFLVVYLHLAFVIWNISTSFTGILESQNCWLFKIGIFDDFHDVDGDDVGEIGDHGQAFHPHHTTI